MKDFPQIAAAVLAAPPDGSYSSLDTFEERC
jgi:hypothetical protein